MDKPKTTGPNCKELIIEWQTKVPSEDVRGWVVAIVGTKRTAYLNGLSPVYDERQASVMSKPDACGVMNKLYGIERSLWRFAMLVPSSSREFQSSNGLPTVNGY